MRRSLIFVAGILVATVAFGAVVVKKDLLYIFKAGVQLGTAGQAVEDSYSASGAIDFAGVTDVCEDSSAITVTGAAVNDLCVVGAPATGPHANSWFTCYVSAANAVKVRHCAHGASGDLASGTYAVRVFDP